MTLKQHLSQIQNPLHQYPKEATLSLSSEETSMHASETQKKRTETTKQVTHDKDGVAGKFGNHYQNDRGRRLRALLDKINILQEEGEGNKSKDRCIVCRNNTEHTGNK